MRSSDDDTETATVRSEETTEDLGSRMLWMLVIAVT